MQTMTRIVQYRGKEIGVSCVAKDIQCGSRYTGVDFSKILGGKTKILREKVVKSDKCMDVSQLLGEHVPGLPPKHTPMDKNKKPRRSKIRMIPSRAHRS